jgi:uncharacterized protein (DUF2235 family)
LHLARAAILRERSGLTAFGVRASMSRNIVLLSDGTGNSAAKVFKTNVWRLFQILDLRDPDNQIAYYDDGVGTSSFKLFAILGGVFGFGHPLGLICKATDGVEVTDSATAAAAMDTAKVRIDKLP